MGYALPGLRSRTGAAIAVVLAATAVVGPSPAAAGAPPGQAALRYVALGDSSAAGPLIPNQIDATCARSDRGWPQVLAARLGAELTNATRSGATTNDLAGRQYGTVPPQFDALRSDTELVTLAIGANDINLASAFQECASQGGPSGRTCQERYTVGGVDQFAARIEATAPKVAAALEAIHRASPAAEVVVVGYLTYWRPGGCYPEDPYTGVDADYIQATFDRLMAMLADQAARHGASYVDIRTPSAGHDVCEPPARRWVEGAVPAAPAYPYHPNATGMAEAAGIIDAAVSR